MPLAFTGPYARAIDIKKQYAKGTQAAQNVAAPSNGATVYLRVREGL